MRMPRFRHHFTPSHASTLVFAALLAVGLGGAGVAQAKPASAKKPAKTAKAAAATPAATRAQGDYIVAVVNNEPVTNQEVHQRAQMLARTLAASGGRAPDRAALLQQALNEVIFTKAATHSARNTTLVLTDEDVDVAEAGLARTQSMQPAEFRKRVMAERGLTQAQYRKDLHDQLLLDRVRDAHVQQAASRVSNQDALQWLGEQQKKAQAAGAGQRMLNLAQVLVAVPKEASPAEVQRLQAKADEALRKIRRGENFASVVHDYTDGAGRDSGGAMGLLPESAYPAEFTSAVQNIPVGQTTALVRSVAGFHILKVLERQQQLPGMALEQSRARHILLRPDSEQAEAQAVAKLADLRKRIAAGKLDFAAAAREFSQDGSAAAGGDLGWAAPGQMVPEFEQELERLQPGQISQPFASRYGVHLVQLLERRAAPMTQEQQLAAARKMLQEQKSAEALRQWRDQIRAQAYIEMREPPR